ncbi:MAG: PDZ domain-containing protein [Deltaproteobacteria bacterium]|nr:PDZ domain-containing protein [Deltaproteobacteria bacterium]
MPVRINPMLDISLARLGVETGRRVEMLLGHSLFLQFATGIDHQAQVLTLARYHEPGALETEMFVGYGIWLVGSPLPGAAPRVAALAHGMEAQQAGIDIGDVIVGIDGRDTVSMTAVELDVALRVGAQGQTIELEVADVMQDGLRQSPPRRVALTKRDLLPAQ